MQRITGSIYVDTIFSIDTRHVYEIKRAMIPISYSKRPAPSPPPIDDHKHDVHYQQPTYNVHKKKMKTLPLFSAPPKTEVPMSAITTNEETAPVPPPTMTELVVDNMHEEATHVSPPTDIPEAVTSKKKKKKNKKNNKKRTMLLFDVASVIEDTWHLLSPTQRHLIMKGFHSAFNIRLLR